MKGKLELIVAGLLIGLALVFQVLSGAFQSEFGGTTDESAHYVTGLMVHDYVAQGFPDRPLRFARNYYEHYPKVALGHWPPCFYIIQAAWSLIFSPSRTSMFIMMAVLAGLTAWVIFHTLKQDFGYGKALLGAVLFLSLPLIQKYTALIMSEILLTLLSFVSILYFGRYLDQGKTKDALAFGLFAAAAVLTKGSALLLAFIPPLSVIIARRFKLLTRPSLWYPAVIVLALSGPWTLIFRKNVASGWFARKFSWEFSRKAIPYYAASLIISLGIVFLIMAIIGLVTKLFLRNTARQTSGHWIAGGALVITFIILQPFIPSTRDSRFLVPAFPFLVMFVIAGAEQTAKWLQRKRLSFLLSQGLVYGLAILLFLAGTFKIEKKGYSGFGPVAETLLSNSGFQNSIFLICSDGTGEGLFISEVAMRERRPGHIIRRATKALASSDWGSHHYSLRFKTEQEILDYLRKERISILIFDSSVPEQSRLEHWRLLKLTIENHPSCFILLDQRPAKRNNILFEGAIAVYRLAPDYPQPAAKIL